MTRPVVDVLAEHPFIRDHSRVPLMGWCGCGKSYMTKAWEGHAEHLAVALADATTDWPCANYRAPLTCLTAPSSKTGRCDFCQAQADATTDTAAPSYEEGYRAGMDDAAVPEIAALFADDDTTAPVDATLTDDERTVLGIAWFDARSPEDMFPAVEQVIARRASDGN